MKKPVELKNAHLTRQADLIPNEALETKINIIGGGAIGSFTALALVKMGYTNITVFDDDTIDVENMNCQFFRHKDIGKLKVDALQELIKDFTNETIEIVADRWTGKPLDGIIIAAVDSMEVRQLIFDAHHKKAMNTSLIIDPRMGAEIALLNCYNPMAIDECKSYAKTLYSDDEATPERCTAKSTIYCALGLSSMVCTAVKNFTVESTYPKNLFFAVTKFDIA